MMESMRAEQQRVNRLCGTNDEIDSAFLFFACFKLVKLLQTLDLVTQ